MKLRLGLPPLRTVQPLEHVTHTLNSPFGYQIDYLTFGGIRSKEIEIEIAAAMQEAG